MMMICVGTCLVDKRVKHLVIIDLNINKES